MPRARSGAITRHRHKKVLGLTKGHRATKHALFRRANESMLKALSYQYRHRRERKGDMRRLWITRISAAARLDGINYSQLIYGLRSAQIEVNRKMLAELAVSDPGAFSQIVRVAKDHIGS